MVAKGARASPHSTPTTIRCLARIDTIQLPVLSRSSRRSFQGKSWTISLLFVNSCFVLVVKVHSHQVITCRDTFESILGLCKWNAETRFNDDVSDGGSIAGERMVDQYV